MNIPFVCNNFSTFLKWVGKIKLAEKSWFQSGVWATYGKNSRTYRLSAASRCVPKLFSSRQPVNSEVKLLYPYQQASRANLQVGATSFHVQQPARIVHLWCWKMYCSFFLFPCRAIMYVRVFSDLVRNIYFTVSSFR